MENGAAVGHPSRRPTLLKYLIGALWGEGTGGLLATIGRRLGTRDVARGVGNGRYVRKGIAVEAGNNLEAARKAHNQPKNKSVHHDQSPAAASIFNLSSACRSQCVHSNRLARSSRHGPLSSSNTAFPNACHRSFVYARAARTSMPHSTASPSPPSTNYCVSNHLTARQSRLQELVKNAPVFTAGGAARYLTLES